MVYLDIYIIIEMLFRGILCGIKEYSGSDVSQKGEPGERMNDWETKERIFEGRKKIGKKKEMWRCFSFEGDDFLLWDWQKSENDSRGWDISYNCDYVDRGGQAVLRISSFSTSLLQILLEDHWPISSIDVSREPCFSRQKKERNKPFISRVNNFLDHRRKLQKRKKKENSPKSSNRNQSARSDRR